MTPTEPWATLRARYTVHEDEAVLVWNKPVGLSVMGERHDTDLVRMAAAAGERLYPVHRIDKATSGLVLLAKRLADHGGLTRQFAARTAVKTYLAVTESTGLPALGEIDLPLRTGRKNRVRVAAPRESIVRVGDRWSVPPSVVFDQGRNYPSTTRFAAVWRNRRRTLVAVRPITGRRHQIRVHLAWIGHPIVADPLFVDAPTDRMLLHSWRLSVDADWLGGRRLDLVAEPGEDFFAPVQPIDTVAVLDRAGTALPDEGPGAGD